MEIATIIPWIMLICWAALILTWIITSFTVKRDVNRGAWWRFWWFRILILGVVAGFVWRQALPTRYTSHSDFINPVTHNVALLTLAAILCVFGIALAIWARLHLGRNWSPAPNVKEEHELVTSGPYKLIRHPIYTGIIMAMLGSAIISPTWLIILIIFTCMFVWRVYVEENLMMKQFPNQYPDYRKKTWALIPWVW